MNLNIVAAEAASKFHVRNDASNEIRWSIDHVFTEIVIIISPTFIFYRMICALEAKSPCAVSSRFRTIYELITRSYHTIL